MKYQKQKFIRSSILILAFFFSVRTAFPSSEQIGIEEKLQKIEKLLSGLSQPESPGFSIGLFFEGKPVFKKCYGLANVEHHIPISDSTLFNIGSSAKQFTALAAAMLAKQKKLSLDEDIHQYMPEMPEFGKTITIRNLIHHTSGLRDWIEGLQLGGHKAEDSFSHEGIIKNFVLSQKTLNFNPGDEFLYCNTGYSLLAEIISRVTGMTFRHWMENNIFSPLSMKNTHIVEDHHGILPNKADSYHISQKGEVTKAILNGSILGAGGMYTTLDDLAKWALNYEDAKVGGADIIQQMNEGGNLNDGTRLDYAFGQYLYDLNGLRLFAHGGSGAGWQASLVRCPEQKFTLIILANNSKMNLNIVFPILNIFFQDKFKPGIRTPKKEKFSYQEAEISPRIHGEYIGRYSYSSTVLYTVSREGDHLTIRCSGQSPENYFPVSEKDFLNKKGEANKKVSFDRDKNGKVISMTLENIEEEKFKTAKKIQRRGALKNGDLARDRAHLNEFSGEYYNDELKVKFSIEVDGDRLVAKHPWGENIIMTHECMDFFWGNRYWGREIEFIRDEKNEISGFIVTGSRIANVQFDRKTIRKLATAKDDPPRFMDRPDSESSRRFQSDGRAGASR